MLNGMQYGAFIYTVAPLSKALYIDSGLHSPHSHTGGGGNHTRQQPAHREPNIIVVKATKKRLPLVTQSLRVEYMTGERGEEGSCHD